MSTDDLIELVIDKVNPEELIDLLDFSTEELMNNVDIRIRFLSRVDRFDYLITQDDKDAE